jgi:predicted ATPase with chaperone activity
MPGARGRLDWDRGLLSFVLVGLADAAVRESRQHVEVTTKNIETL